MVARTFLVALAFLPALYAHAQAPQTQAQKLVERFDRLTIDETQKLAELGNEAFDALLPLVRKRLARCNIYKDVEPGKTEASRAFREAVHGLTRVAQAKHAATLVELYREAKGEPAAHLVLRREWIPRRFEPGSSSIKNSDANLLVPICLEALKGATGYSESDALRYITQSSHPLALEFLKKSLADPKVDVNIRTAAFANLARTGGEEFIPAILAAREANRRIPTIAEYLRLEALPTNTDTLSQSGREIFKTATDAKGQTWGLLRSPILGGENDYWVVRKEKDRWVEPIFIEGMGTLENWLAYFAENSNLRVDTDSDGWTDVLERRIGTNPQQADTDSDSLKDSEDANPWVAPRPLNETEKVLAAAFEAHYPDSASQGKPYRVRLPEGVAPLELPGSGWITKTMISTPGSSLEEPVRRVGSTISFQTPRFGRNGEALPRNKDKAFLIWNADHTQATLEVMTYYGNLGASGNVIEVKKFGDNWIAIRSDVVWVS